MVAVSSAVEGLVDEAVAKRLIIEAGGIPGPVYGKMGKATLRNRIVGYNSAAARDPWLVLVDLDHEADCAPDMRRDWLPTPALRLCFRIAVREVEAWLFADKERLAKFLSVPVGRIPTNPDAIENPKEEMVRLAGTSKSREIRQDMVPSAGSGRSVGPAYTSRLIEFVAASNNPWRPTVAQTQSDSLRRCLANLKRLVGPAD
jgi:hypothetical protein